MYMDVELELAWANIKWATFELFFVIPSILLLLAVLSLVFVLIKTKRFFFPK